MLEQFRCKFLQKKHYSNKQIEVSPAEIFSILFICQCFTHQLKKFFSEQSFNHQHIQFNNNKKQWALYGTTFV